MTMIDTTLKIFAAIIFLILVACVIGLIYDVYVTEQKRKRIKNEIDEIKNKLNALGVIFNHSLELSNINSGNVAYLRVYSIHYDHAKSNYVARAYICDKNHEIGEWEDNVEYLYTIPENNEIKDYGEWNPNKINEA